MSRRRLSPRELLGDNKIGPSKAPLRKIFFLKKNTKNERGIKLKDWSIDEFSYTMANIILNDEFKNFASQFFETTFFLTSEEWMEKYIKSLSERLRKVNTEIIYIEIPKIPEYAILERKIIDLIY